MSRSDERSPDPPGEPELDFERADFGQASEPEAGGPMLCSLCQVPIGDQYFTVASAFVCVRCEGLHRNAGPLGSAFSRFGGSVALGSVAAVVASAVWMAVTELTGYEIGLIAIAVGWIVATAVQLGNRGVGGAPYQVLAVFLTYTAIVMTYVPFLLAEIDSQSLSESGSQIERPTPGDAPDGEALPEAEFAQSEATEENPSELTDAVVLIVVILTAYARPFLAGFENAIGILIIGFALYQAWKMTVKRVIVWDGPFQVGTGSVG